MTWLVRVAALAAVSITLLAPPASAQRRADLTNSKIEFSYFPPKTQKYQSVMARLKSRQVLQRLSQFLAPLRLPHTLFLVTMECGSEGASPHYRSDIRAIVLCYEFIDWVDRVSPRPDQPWEGITHDEVVVGAFTGVVLHELGHATFYMLEVPVFGREEDAADSIGIFIALQFSKDVARTVTRGLAYLFAKSGNPKEWAQYADEHGTSAQRFYNTLCVAYGGDPQNFREFVDKGWLPKERAAGCATEYQQVRFAFARTIFPFIDQNLMKQVQARDWLAASARP
ncbi:MAG: hypothetical protein IT537_03830 [Hyphomicrobiales bacterium]|nr:hypothetical protein [Hyphomicrobiales bacterium]